MADDMMKAIKQALLVVLSAVAVIGITFLSMMVYGLLIGAFNQQAQAGNIAVDNNTLNNMTAQIGSYWTTVGTVTTVVTAVVGFITLAVLFMIFRPFIGKVGKIDKKGGKTDY